MRLLAARGAGRMSVLAALALLWPVQATAGELPGPTAPFSGVMVVTMPPAKPLSIRIDYTERKVRREVNAYGTHFVAIVDHDRDRTVMLFPDLRRYAIRPLDTDRHDMVKQIAKGARIEKVGPEPLGGRETVKYRIEGKSPRDREFTGFIWLTPENVMVRMEATTTAKGGEKPRRVTIEMRELKIGSVDPAVFRIPEGYEKVDRSSATPR